MNAASASADPAVPAAPAVLVLALDGATFDVIDPLVAEGRLPNLAAWTRAGDARTLASTTPAMTFPAWSSFMTGLGPGRHGIFDFTQKVEGAWRIRFTNARDRLGASVFRRVSEAGRDVLVLGMPATFPPEHVNGLLVSGFDAPVSTGTDGRSASDPARYRAVADRVGPWMRPDLDEAARGDAWHERAVETLLGRIDRKTAFALEALAQHRAREGERPALMTVVFSESDTAAHHYWRDHDAASPRHEPGASAQRRGALAAVYERLDAACGALREAFGEDALCVVVSDHGFGGAGRHVVHLNRHLADCGLLRRRPRGGALTRVSRGARDTALRLLPPRIAQAAFRRLRAAAAQVESAARFGGTDWARTAAISEEANTQPGVWLNLRGRESEGSVAPADAERVRREVIEALLDWRLPGGGPVVARARPREEVYRGPCVERAPDIVVELALDAGYGLSLVPTPWSEASAAVRRLADDELGGGRGRGMNGTHRPDGIWIASGPGVSAAPEAASAAARQPGTNDRGAGASIVDVAPTLLAALGIPWRDALDGAKLRPRAYTADEDARVAERLRALGYLE